MIELHCGDCLEVMAGMPDNSVDAIVTDPPYFKVKGEAWDNQWAKPAEFIAWMGKLSEQWKRILKPNGSLYVFASPKMAHSVEGCIRERFSVLLNIRWQKPPFSTKAEMFKKEDLRCFFPASETIIFAEHYGADNIAKGEAGYAAKCDELRGFVFEPLRAYLDGERERSGFDRQACDKACGNQMSGHYFSRVQWTLPTEANYAKLREAFGPGFLERQYEDLRREYEDLRRPFAVTAEDQYTDVWTFKTVQAYAGKHVCEKPQELLRHIVKTSTRPGAIVLDCFAGSHSTGEACIALGRSFIGIEMDPHWHQRGALRLSVQPSDLHTPQVAPEVAPEVTPQVGPRQTTIFDFADHL